MLALVHVQHHQVYGRIDFDAQCCLFSCPIIAASPGSDWQVLRRLEDGFSGGRRGSLVQAQAQAV